MKKLFVFISLLPLAFVSCRNDEFDLVSQTKCEEVTLTATVETQSGQLRDTKTYLGDDLSVLWESGDKLSVLSYSSKQPSNDEFTVKTGIGTPNATFSGKLSDASKYYVIYPYDENIAFNGSNIKFKIPQHQNYKAGTFSQNSNIMYASFTKSDMMNIKFKNLCGVFSLQLTGANAIVTKIAVSDNSGKMVWGDVTLSPAGAIDDVVGNMTIQNGNNTIFLDNITGVELSGDPVCFNFIVPAGAFEEGFTAYVYTEKGVYSFFSTESDNKINRSKIRLMPPYKTSAPSKYDLTADGRTANTYIVVAEGSYNFTPTVGNGELVTGIKSAGVLWETENTAETPTVGCIIKTGSVKYENDIVSFEATGKAGSAVIATYDENGKVLYSWHIWSTAEPIELAKFQSGAVFMDRNLGAANKVVGDAKSAGFLYQWGRCNPFPGTASFTEDYKPIKYTPEFPDIEKKYDDVVDNITVGTYEYANAHPQVFIKDDTRQVPNWRNSNGKDGWSDAKKTRYDPCPWGYRVPVSNDYSNISYSKDVSLHSAIHGFYVNGSNYFPITGATSAQSKGIFWIVKTTSTDPLYASHTASKNATNVIQTSYRLTVAERTFTYTGSTNFATLRSIRCVKFNEEPTIGGGTQTVE